MRDIAYLSMDVHARNSVLGEWDGNVKFRGAGKAALRDATNPWETTKNLRNNQKRAVRINRYSRTNECLIRQSNGGQE